MNSRDLVLLGGGHAHVLAIRALAIKAAENTRITLISEHTLTPYSGMLPGYVAGHYRFDETHIDLNRLCQRSGVRWIHARAVGLDLDARQVNLDAGAPVRFDWLSIDTGSRPDTATTGAAEHAVGVKPVSGFAARWQAVLRQISGGHGRALDIGVIGAGAGGTELALAIAHRLRDAQGLTVHWLYPGGQPLSDYPEAVVRAVGEAVDAHRIQTHPYFRVTEVSKSGVTSARGQQLELDHTLWCTAASAPGWPADAGLTTDDQGFITVDPMLRSVSHPFVFAAGDIAHMPFDPRPKAGVYAVRQAPFLTENIRCLAAQRPLKPLRLQRQFLSLLSLGAQRAVGTRNGLSLAGKWVWHLKDRIDRAFMQRIQEAGGSMQPKRSQTPGAMHCAGCASKLGPTVVAGSVAALPVHENPAVTPALAVAEDASRWRPAPGREVVQSIDGFRAFTEDGYRFGRIATNHALSDLYAMGAQPVSAMVWLNLAFNHPRLQARDHQQIMAGVADALLEQQCVIAGGHSSEGMETHLGLAVTGELDSSGAIEKHGVRDADVLVLTKALGVGVILAANQTGDAPASSLERAVSQMLQSNRAASAALAEAHAMTDVTGYGLLGHAIEMLEGSELVAELDLAAVPEIEGARSLLEQGYRSSLHPALLPLLARTNQSSDDPDTALCLDPQTSGGLLASVPASRAATLLAAHPCWTVVGLIRQRRAQDADCAVIFTNRNTA